MGVGEELAGSPWDWISRTWGPLADQGITMEQVKKGPVKRELPLVPYENGTFRTSDGKFQFITEYEGRPERKRSGLTLLMVKKPSFLNSQLLEEDAKPIPNVRLNPALMADLGLEDGDRISVRSSLDQIEALARASEKTRPDVAELGPSMWKGDQGGINRLREALVSDLGPTSAGKRNPRQYQQTLRREG